MARCTRVSSRQISCMTAAHTDARVHKGCMQRSCGPMCNNIKVHGGEELCAAISLLRRGHVMLHSSTLCALEQLRNPRPGICHHAAHLTGPADCYCCCCTPLLL